MRVNHIESRLEQQLTLKTLILNSVDNLTKVGYSNITPHRVHARLSALKENWEKFSLIHDAINLAVTKLSNDEKVQMQSHAYFSNNLFAATHESYLEAVEKMNSTMIQNVQPMVLPHLKIQIFLCSFIMLGYRALTFP